MTSVAVLAQAVRASAPRLGSVSLVCVDGPAGSGKTTVADRLADALGASVVHLDDMYEGWSGLDAVADRLTGQVLDPLTEGRPARYQRYDWAAETFTEWVDLPVPDVLVVEGCGSASRVVRARASLVVWVEAPLHVRVERGVARDGEHLRDEWLRWVGLETSHFARERTKEAADVVLDGTVPLTP